MPRWLLSSASSQLVASCCPVVPALDRLLCLCILGDELELRPGDRERVSILGHEHEHLVVAFLLWSQPNHLDLVADP